MRTFYMGTLVHFQKAFIRVVQTERFLGPLFPLISLPAVRLDTLGGGAGSMGTTNGKGRIRWRWVAMLKKRNETTFNYDSCGYFAMTHLMD